MITVVGSLNMDLVVRAPRFPRAGETLAGRHFTTAPGGKGANQAVAARRAGGQVAMAGCVGDDEFGTALRQGLAAEGIDVRHVHVLRDVPTGIASITVDDRGENTIIVVGGANGAMTATHVDAARDAVAAAGVLLLQLEVPLAVAERAAALAHDGGATVILNAAPARELDDRLLAVVDYLVVNETEALEIAGGTRGEAGRASTRDAARRARSRGAGAVVVTLGAAGAELLDRRGDFTAVPAFRVDVVDSTAAGDAFVGAFAVALAEGVSPVDALRFGNAAGALAATRAGAQPSLPTRMAIDALVASTPR